MLLAYAKIDLNDEILDSDLPDDPLLEGELLRYFPTALQREASSRRSAPIACAARSRRCRS